MTPDFILLYLAVSGSTGLNDRDLARRIRSGDLKAFRQFFEDHKALLTGFLRKRQVPDDVAGDIIQNAFITIWERRTEIDENKSLRAYLFRISYTRALNHFRDTAKFTVSHVNDESPLLHIPGSGQTGPEQQADYAIIRDALDRIIAGMPEKRSAVFELCFLQELTYREAAEVLDVSIKTVENHMALALKTVREGMEKFR
ncbi:MAG: sigma-70 family RNA polymerase sigma factor [Rhodothermaceae bacterium]|nr:sigma-70 family RNA polymerase sigma factor [Rhodothermaceae bacterium]